MSAPARLSLPARIDSLGEATAFVSACALREGLAPGPVSKIELALEEALVNICTHAYPEGPGDVEIACRLAEGRFEVEIADRGVPFDLTALADPDVGAGVEERPVGGLGVFLMRRMMDEIRYRREGVRNILTLVKTIP
jgi:serine/threonine-protein kinase RsbW